MEFSRDWLADYVRLPPTEELAERLTAAGLAVETVEERDGDAVLDVDVTTNRPDCMCHLGLAREIAVACDRELCVPEPELSEAAEAAQERISIRIERGAGCPTYVGRVIRDVEVGESPDWLKKRLETIGLRPVNNVVDVTNYVLWETGQPLHAFDLATLAGPEIVVRRGREGESLRTLDGEVRQLDEEILVIADAEEAVAIAGVMGGLATEVTEHTTDVLLESAHFEPRRVRRGAARLDMHTDASHRFERGTDPTSPVPVADRAAALIAELTGGTVLRGAVRAVDEELPVLGGDLALERLRSFAGLAIEARDVERILVGLGFGIERAAEGAWKVEVPGWRRYDMAAVRPDGRVWEADLFEEVLRHVGFDEIPSSLPPVAGPDAGDSHEHVLRQAIRQVLRACGLAEAVTYAFHSADEDAAAPDVWKLGVRHRLANPLSELYAVMRRSLAPGLLAAARFNQRRGAPAVRLYEIGHLFPGAEQDEVETVGVLAGGAIGTPWERERTIDVFDVKGWVEELGRAFGVRLEARPAEVAGLVPGSGGELVAEGRVVGWIGRIDETEGPYPLLGAELETGVLAAGSRFGEVEQPSRHPGVSVDSTLTHPLATAWAEIAAAIDDLRPQALTAYHLKDRYIGEGVPEGSVNTTIAFQYGADDRSLTQDEVNERHSRLTAELERRFGSNGGDSG